MLSAYRRLLLTALLAVTVAITVAACGATEPTPKSLCQPHRGIEWVKTGPEPGEETVLCRDGHGYRLLPNE